MIKSIILGVLHFLWPVMQISSLKKILDIEETYYRRLNNQIRWEAQNVTKIKEKEITRCVKENPKVFWKNVLPRKNN